VCQKWRDYQRTVYKKHTGMLHYKLDHDFVYQHTNYLWNCLLNAVPLTSLLWWLRVLNFTHQYTLAAVSYSVKFWNFIVWIVLKLYFSKLIHQLLCHLCRIVLSTLVQKTTVFWDVVPCSLTETDHPLGWWWRQ
jgi:hypothetical protein